ncbi:uncharacterized protein PV09_00316 [Verruconis gallopava]|uniref:Maintenance of telomere capping protein 1 n=1 Tax=Verruconis gallopava TaxID=253628 RepID=A0A0D1Y348_9PEZI|nr:uncharacterized protein PV09_00316 [Verruconis gallopava]KIW09431.1 hypothetical protein PV09_00316 [Verruconis gallopava]
MAQKKPLTDEELLAQFETLEESTSKSSSSKQTQKPKSTAAAPPADDPLAELESLAKARPSSRPSTPKVSLGQQRSVGASAAAATPGSTPAGSTRNSEDNKARAPPRKSGESTRSFHQGLTPTAEEERQAQQQQDEKDSSTKSASEQPNKSGGGWGGWFSGITATATAAVKQAEAYAKEIQKNEEAQKWTEQLRGRVGDLKGLGGDLRTRALPTFASIINTIAPPISQHERLQIHITHDLVGYPSLDPTIYAVFSRVMSQVEGGDLLVIQRGSESSQRRASDAAFRGGSSGWNDGPWWRDGHVRRDMGIVAGLREGTKLARVSAEAYAKEFFDARGGLQKAAEQATKILSDTNPVRSSDVFLAIQPVGYELDDSLYEGPPEERTEAGGVQDENERDELVAFAVYLYDPVHALAFKSLSQGFPRKWAEWLDAENVPDGDMQLPEEIIEIINSGGVDPREWVAEWVEEIISQVTGVVAQRYVARRMGVGEGGIGRGKARQEFDEAAAGEAARAGVI